MQNLESISSEGDEASLRDEKGIFISLRNVLRIPAYLRVLYMIGFDSAFLVAVAGASYLALFTE